MAGIVLAVAFLFGVLLQDSGAGWVLAVPLLGAGVAAFVFTGRGADRALVLLALILLSLGSWRASGHADRPIQVAVYPNSDQGVVATIVSIPRRESTRVNAEISLGDGNGRPFAVSLPPYPVVNNGDEISFQVSDSWEQSASGAVLVPVPSAGGAVFIPSFEVTQSSPSLIERFRIRTNSLLTLAIEQYVPEPAGALTLGVLNGDDSGMTAATRQHFRASGMSHITAVSGWNVALIAGLISIFTRRLAPTSLVTLLASAGVVWAYAFLVGMGPSVVRAAGMATVFLAARWRGRQGDLVTSILLTVAVVVAVTPDIRFDFGFQLSVAATLGIVLFVEQFPNLPEWQTAVALPFVAEIATAPLQLHHFGTFSLVAPLTNLVSAPFVGLVMAGGVATVIASLIHPALAEIAGIVTWVPARMIVSIAERQPVNAGTSGSLFALSWSATFVTYVMLALGYCVWSIRLKLTRLQRRSLGVG